MRFSTFESIDPGKRKTARAVWRGGQLSVAVHEDNARHSSRAPAVVVVEVPQVYTRGSNDRNDLIDLAFAAGLWCAHASVVVQVRPAAWKGQIPQDILEARIKNALRPEELECITHTIKSLMHNVWDAIGIGLNHLGRL